MISAIVREASEKVTIPSMNSNFMKNKGEEEFLSISFAYLYLHWSCFHLEFVLLFL